METKFSAAIRGHKNALEAVNKSLNFILQIPGKADSVLYTAEVQAQVEESTKRIQQFVAQTEAELKTLQEWHLAEIGAGRCWPLEEQEAPACTPGFYAIDGSENHPSE